MYEDITLLRIKELEEFIKNELENVTSETDTTYTTAKIMYMVLRFSIENNHTNEHILHNECWKNWDLTKKEFMNKIP